MYVRFYFKSKSIKVLIMFSDVETFDDMFMVHDVIYNDTYTIDHVVYIV